MARSKDRERFFQHQGAVLKEAVTALFPRIKSVDAGNAWVGSQAPLTATKLTADTCCALGVHSQWCGCDRG